MKQDNKDSFMKNITLNLKHFALLFILAMFSVTASAVTITYSLTTKVDGRTITANANMSSGASLEDNMPQTMWRGYTTYTYYSDATLTQQITNAPNANVTVYVDYVFAPPFILSEVGKDPVWLYFRNSPGVDNKKYYLYKTSGNSEEFHATKALSNLSNRRQAYFAFYGDAYSLSIKFDDYNNNYSDDFMQPVKTRPFFLSPYRPNIGEEIKPGWQLYENKYGSGYFSLQIPEPKNGNNSDFLYIYDSSNYLQIQALLGYTVRDSHNAVCPQTANDYNYLEPIAFVATPATSNPTIMDFWHVTYKIQKYGGTSMYDDIVIQKTSSNLKPTFPPAGFVPNQDYAYDYFYKDIDFTEMYPRNYTMPNTENTVIYIREVDAISEPWKTLVLPYDIDNLSSFFGGDDAVKVLKYTSVDGELNGDAFKCNLHFTPVSTIEAGCPYLFKAERVSQNVLTDMYNINGSATAQAVTFEDEENEDVNDIFVSMKGVLDDGGYSMPEDGLNFFFGSVPNGNDYIYKFYRVGGSISNITIPKFRCYFYVTDGRNPSGAPIRVSFGTESITGVSSVVADVKVNNSIYSLDGRKVNASSLDNLKRGIYIINGRKVVK